MVTKLRCRPGSEVHVASVNPQAPGGSCAGADLLQDEVPAPVDGGRGAGDGADLAELGAVGGIVVVDGGAVGEGDGLREVYLVPDDGADASGGVGGKGPVGIIGETPCRGVEITAVSGGACVGDRGQQVAGVAEGEVVNDAPGGSAGASVTGEADNVAVAVVGVPFVYCFIWAYILHTQCRQEQ